MLRERILDLDDLYYKKQNSLELFLVNYAVLARPLGEKKHAKINIFTPYIHHLLAQVG